MYEQTFDATIGDLKSHYDKVVGLAIESLNSRNVYVIVEATTTGVVMMGLIVDPPERTPGKYEYDDDRSVRVVNADYLKQIRAPFKWNAIAALYPDVNNEPKLIPPETNDN